MPPLTNKEEGLIPLDAINTSAIDNAPTDPDSKTLLEKESIEAQFLREKIRSLSQDIDERKKYAHRIFCLICAWLGTTSLILIADGFCGGKWFSLSQPVLLALIGGTSVDVLGIFYIVTHYLFPTLGDSSPHKEAAQAYEVADHLDSN